MNQFFLQKLIGPKEERKMHREETRQKMKCRISWVESWPWDIPEQIKATKPKNERIKENESNIEEFE